MNALFSQFAVQSHHPGFPHSKESGEHQHRLLAKQAREDVGPVSPRVSRNFSPAGRKNRMRKRAGRTQTVQAYYLWLRKNPLKVEPLYEESLGKELTHHQKRRPGHLSLWNEEPEPVKIFEK